MTELTPKRLYTGYFAQLRRYKDSQGNPLPVFSIARSSPPGIKLTTLPWLHPSERLLKDWKAGRIKWDEYCTRYRDDTWTPDINDRLMGLPDDSVLLCWEKYDNPHCHRHLVAGWFTDQEQRIMVEYNTLSSTKQIGLTLL